jgi:hypothetical protein
LSARTSGTVGGTTELMLPELSADEKTTHHSVRVVADVYDVRRMLVFRRQRPTLVEDQGGATTGVVYAGPLVEFGSEPGSRSWIDFNFDPEFQVWSVTDSGGDRIIRETAIYTEERRGNIISEIGFPLYFTPEVSSATRTATANTLLWIPQGVRRILGSDGMVVEIGSTIIDTSVERTTDTDNAGSYVLGYTDVDNRAIYGSPAIQNGIEGWVALHEIGHMVDNRWLSASNTHKLRQGEPWASLSGVPGGLLNAQFYTEIVAASDNAGIYAYAFSTYQEYFAEIFATSMCAQRYMDTGLNYAAFSAGKTGIVGSADPDNLWPGIEAKMKSYGLITYSGTLT